MSETRQQRRARKRAKAKVDRQRQNAALPDWYTNPPPGWSRDTDDFPACPPEDLFNADHCSLAGACEGCGNTEHLGVNTSVMAGADGWDVACATVCRDCDGRSFIHIVGFDGFAAAVERHQHHTESEAVR